MHSTFTSVVIIFLNGEAFLEEAIGSVRLQTHSNWELLLVDDGSQDSSSQIARRAAEADPARVRYLRHPDGENHGTSASRNLGAMQAAGTYLLFLDCDDLLLPDHLSRHAAVLDSEPDLAAAFSPTLFWLWDQAYASGQDSIQSVGNFGNRRVQPPALLVAMLHDESLHPANCGSLFRRAVFNSCGGFDESFRGMYEDTTLLTKLLMRHTTYVIADCLSAYRAHRASQCNRAQEAGEYDSSGPSSSRLKYLTWARAYTLATPGTDASVLHALDHEIMAHREGLRPFVARVLALLIRRVRRGVARICGGSSRGEPPDAELEVMHRIRDVYLTLGLSPQADTMAARITELGARQDSRLMSWR
jgi:glycosyltransferase involved in cell wall biosynthesis